MVDPRNFLLVGVPPKDMIEDVAQALTAAGIDADKFFEKACTVTREWNYDKANHARVKDRIRQKINNDHGVPLKFRTLAEVLNPQPNASVVTKRLLNWIDRVDTASQTGGAPKPAFQTEDGHSIFPEDDDPWWLTDISRRAPVDEEEKAEGDEDGPPSEVEEQQQEVSDDDPESELGVAPPRLDACARTCCSMEALGV